jgi:hypothetical protein
MSVTEGGFERLSGVSIQAILAALWLLALRDWVLGVVRRSPVRLASRGSGEGIADRSERVDAVLDSGGGAAADSVAVMGDGLGTEAPGDLLLGLRGA